MFRRPIRRAVRRMGVSAVAQNEVLRANQLLQLGQFVPAAEAFMHLARQMERFGKPRQAANLHAQAALAWAKAGIEERATNQANIAFSQFTLLGMQQRIAEFKAEFDQTLHPRKPVQEGNVEAAPVRPAMPAAAVLPAVQQRGKLPATCTQCGAPVRADEVEWIDDTSAECEFCGAILDTK